MVLDLSSVRVRPSFWRSRSSLGGHRVGIATILGIAAGDMLRAAAAQSAETVRRGDEVLALGEPDRASAARDVRKLKMEPPLQDEDAVECLTGAGHSLSLLTYAGGGHSG